jgi:N-hydroxyarylamine O-acetyltransferase
MNDNQFELKGYLERIRYGSVLDTSIECLTSLHSAQLYTIPFENLDIHLGKSIDLAPDKLIQKLVYDKRGGYCFELNGLFLMALQAIGFDARPLLGRVHITGKPTGRGHQVTLVEIDGEQWVVDVGFGGDTPRCPIALTDNAQFKLKDQTLRIGKSREFGFMLQIQKNSMWENLYSFDLGHVYPGDIEYGNYYTSTSPNSVFVNARIAVRPTKAGTLTLFNNTFKKVISDAESCVEISHGQEYIEVLEKQFGIKLDHEPDALMALFTQ